jgi:hypothetical protein
MTVPVSITVCVDVAGPMDRATPDVALPDVALPARKVATQVGDDLREKPDQSSRPAAGERTVTGRGVVGRPGDSAADQAAAAAVTSTSPATDPQAIQPRWAMGSGYASDVARRPRPGLHELGVICSGSMSGQVNAGITSGGAIGPSRPEGGDALPDGGAVAERTARWLLGASAALGAVGLSLELAGIRSPVRAVCILLFLAVAPTVAVERLLPDTDRFGHFLVSCTATVVILGAVAIVMLAAGVWSPVGGVIATAAVVAMCVVGKATAVRDFVRRVTSARQRGEAKDEG